MKALSNGKVQPEAIKRNQKRGEQPQLVQFYTHEFLALLWTQIF